MFVPKQAGVSRKLPLHKSLAKTKMSQTPRKRNAHDQLQKAVRLQGRATRPDEGQKTAADDDFRLELAPPASAKKAAQEDKGAPLPTQGSDWPWEEDHCAHRKTVRPKALQDQTAREAAPCAEADTVSGTESCAVSGAEPGTVQDTVPDTVQASGDLGDKPLLQDTLKPESARASGELQSDKAPEARSNDWPTSQAEPTGQEELAARKEPDAEGPEPSQPEAGPQDTRPLKPEDSVPEASGAQSCARDNGDQEGLAVQEAAPARARRIPRALARLGKGLCIVILSLLVLFLGALLCVQLNMDRITSLALQEISARTNCKLGFDGVTMRLVPLPAIRLDNVHLVLPGKDSANTDAGSEAGARGLALFARALYFAPNFLTLLSGKFEPETIALDEPRVVGELSLAFGDLAKGGRGEETDLARMLPLHCSLAIKNASVTLWDREGSLLQVEGLSADLALTNLPMANPLNGLDGSISLARGSLQTRDLALAAADVHLKGKAGLADPVHDMSLEVKARTAITPLSLALATHVQLKGTREGLGGRGIVRGSMTFDGAVIPYEFAGSIEPGSTEKYAELVREEAVAAAKPLRVRLDTLALGNDVLNLDAVLYPVPGNPAVAGRLGIERVSLTRWLTFARHLSPGLQISLDKITDGFIDFYLDTRHLRAPNIRACAAGATFRGKGGIADWKNIEIFLDMKSDFVDLGRAIPESVGNMQAPPRYAHRPLTEMSGADILAPAAGDRTSQDDASLGGAQSRSQAAQEKAASGAQGPAAGVAENGQTADRGQERAVPKKRRISYDIRLGAAKIHYGYADIVEGGVVIHPGTNSQGEDSARLDMRAGLFGGTCTGYAHFSGQKESEYEFAIKVASASLGKLHRAMDFIPFVSGTGSCQVEVTSRGSEIHRFLANLRGRIQVTGKQTVMARAERFSPMNLDCDLRLATAAFKNSALGISGTWDVAVKGSKGWSADIVLPGMVWFGGREGSAGVRMDNLAGKISVRNTEKLVPAFKRDNVPMELQGRTSLDTSKNVVRMNSGHFELPGAVFDGSVEATIGKSPSLEGTFSRARIDLPKATPLIRQKPVSYPKFLENLTLTSVRVKLTDHDVSLDRFATHVDGIPLQGRLALDFARERPHITFDLHAGSVNLDTYLGEKKKGGESLPQGSVQRKKWDFSAMREFSAKGNLRVDSLRVKKVTIANVRLPMTLANGHLDVPSLKGSVYQGELAGKGSVDFDHGLAFSSTLKITQFDLGAMLRDRQIKGIFRGWTDFAATLSSSMQGPGELARNLNGRLSFQTGQGSYQSVDGNMRPKGKPTLFNRAGCTGQISAGVLRTSDFALMGPDLRLTGSGWIDLSRETLDMNFVADMNNLPNIPLRLHGTFDHPETDIKGGMVILNAIGGIFSGIFGFLGDMLGGIIGIFS